MRYLCYWLRKRALSGYTWSIFFLFVTAFLAGAPFKNTPNPDFVRLAKEAQADTPASGGPSETADKSFTAKAGALADSDNPKDTVGNYVMYGSAPLVNDGSVLGSASPLNNISREYNGIIKYKAQKGDTVSEISARFGISLETIRWANPGLRSFLREDQELVILPISGILYETRENDSIESVASAYKISPELIKKHNPDYQKTIDGPGGKLVLPYASLVKSSYAGADSNLPVVKNYFALPARGWNWGELHAENAIDIADVCDNPVYASAEGLVIESSDAGYWNQGYGNYILIEHPNGVKTKYGHNKENLIKIGDFVAQGDKIALIGNTGKTHGVTGCHLHFEVHGAQNPFAVK